MLDFIWSYKKPRLNQHLLSTPRKRGGLALPDLRKYYTAPVLSSFLKRYSDSYTAAQKEVMDEPFLLFSFREVIWQEPSS